MLHGNVDSDLLESASFCVYKYLKYALCLVQLSTELQQS